jgi:hypothetical protein
MLHQDCQSNLFVDLSPREQEFLSGGKKAGEEFDWDDYFRREKEGRDGEYGREGRYGQYGKKYGRSPLVTKSIIFAPIFK